MFIFVIQFLWRYIDDLVGKGLDVVIILKLIALFACFMVPTVLPLAILLSSVMTMGSLAEQLELVSFKSAGVSLYRCIFGLFIIVCLLTGVSLLFSNTFIPKATLQYYVTLSTIRNTKLALNFKPNIFNSEMNGVSIRVGNKSKDQSTIYDVMIYDHTSGYGADNVLIADSGKLSITPNQKYLQMRLYNGEQYKEIPPEGVNPKYEHYRTKFSYYEKLYDMSAFKLNSTDESLFKNHQDILSFAELKYYIDSIQDRVDATHAYLKQAAVPYIAYVRANDSLPAMLKDKIVQHASPLHVQMDDKEKKQKVAMMMQNFDNYISMNRNDIQSYEKRLNKLRTAFHLRLMLAFACILLFLIGAPMGAIIKKGGLGMPMLVSIVFFVVFYIINTIGENLSEKGVLYPLFGVWLSTYILFPIALCLLYFANNDTLSTDKIKYNFTKIFKQRK